MRRKKAVKVIRVVLYKEQADIIQKIDDEGSEFSEIIRGLISKYGAEKYPPVPLYAQAQMERTNMAKRTQEEQEAWDKLSPEEYTIKTLRGRVWNGEAHFIGPNGTQVHYPLNEIKEQTMKNFLIKAHQTYLDHTYQWDTGISLQPPNIKEIDEQLRDWVARTGGEENNQEQYLQK